MAKTIAVGTGLVLGEDGIVRRGSRPAKPDDVPRRYDLPFGHPLRGKRVVENVPACMPDCVINEDGKLVPYSKPSPVVPEVIR